MTILHVKHSRTKQYHQRQKGKIGKNCKWFNKDNLTCNNKYSGQWKEWCNAGQCDCYVDNTGKIDKHKAVRQLDNGLSEYDENYIQIPLSEGRHEPTMEYIGLSKTIGTPCHPTYLKSDGKRRHKKHCIYYRDNNECAFYFNKCIGSSHCKRYKENNNEW